MVASHGPRPLLSSGTYDPLKDLAPVTLAGFTPLILVVHPSVQAQSVKDLIALAKAKPGYLTFTHVPYKGGTPAVTDLVGGQISMFFAGMPIVRALAVTVTRRSPAAPAVPTMEEAGAIALIARPMDLSRRPS